MSNYQCPEFHWCDNGSVEYPCRMGEHFWQKCFQASMSAFKKHRLNLSDSTGVIVGVSFTPTDDVVPLISITVGDDAQADMSLVEAEIALAALQRAISIARPFWDARPDVVAVYADPL